MLTPQWKREILTLEAEQVLKVDSNQDSTVVDQKPVAISQRPNFNIDKSKFVDKTPSRMLNPKILSWCSIGTEYINSINNEDYDEKCLQAAKYTKLFAKSVAETDSHRIVETAIQGLNLANTEIKETSKSVSDAIMKAETDFKETTILRRFVKYESDYHSSIDDVIEYIKEGLVAIENGMGRFSRFLKLVGRYIPDSGFGFSDLETYIDDTNTYLKSRKGQDSRRDDVISRFKSICADISYYMSQHEDVDSDELGFAYFEVKSFFESWRKNYLKGTADVADTDHNLDGLHDRYVSPLKEKYGGPVAEVQ